MIAFMRIKLLEFIALRNIVCFKHIEAHKHVLVRHEIFIPIFVFLAFQFLKKFEIIVIHNRDLAFEFPRIRKVLLRHYHITEHVILVEPTMLHDFDNIEHILLNEYTLLQWAIHNISVVLPNLITHRIVYLHSFLHDICLKILLRFIDK